MANPTVTATRYLLKRNMAAGKVSTLRKAMKARRIVNSTKVWNERPHRKDLERARMVSVLSVNAGLR